jgi:hypothetical protein
MTSRAVAPYGLTCRKVNLPVDGGSSILEGNMVSQLSASGMLVPAGTALSGPCIGIATHDMDNTNGADDAKRCLVAHDGIFLLDNATGGDACSEATMLYSTVYIYDPVTVADNSNGGARKIAGLFMGMEESGQVRVYIGRRSDAVSAAADISIADAGTFTSTTTVEEALQELYQNALTVSGFIPISLTTLREVNSSGDVGNAAAIGGVLASDTTPILMADANESMEVNWAASNSDIVAFDVSLPKDLDDTANVTVDLLVASGSTDAASFTILTSWNKGTQVTDSFDDSATKSATLHVITATIAAADVPANALSLSVQLVPPAHTTNAIILGGIRINYKRKLLAA